jgi:acyl-CoA synthetase (AMP-forming)/AMP-acid ligase II
VGRPDDRLGEVPVAYVVPSHGAAAVDENALRAWARDQLSAYKIPVAWHVRQALPINAAGKLIRHRLADGPDA